jgi:TPR repeat protein
MPELRTAIARAPAIPAVLFALAGAACFMLAGRDVAHWQPPLVAAAVLLATISAGLALRSRAARWAAALVSAAMVVLMLVLVAAMARELAHDMHSSNGLEALIARVGWVFTLVPAGLGIGFALFAISMFSATAKAAFGTARWDALVLAGVLAAALLGARWYRRADYYGDPCRRGDQYACTEFAKLVPDRAAAFAPAQDLCAQGDSLSAPEACDALGFAAWKRHDSAAAMPLFIRACTARPNAYCYRIAHDPNVGLTPGQAASLYSIACAKGQRASCEGLGKALRAAGDVAGAAQALDTACVHGEFSACETLGDLQLKSGDTVSALRSLKTACEYEGVGCRDIAFVERVQGSNDSDRWYTDGCQGRPPEATREQCLAAGEAYLRKADSTAARRYFLRACTWGLQPACTKLKPLRESYEIPRPGR